MANPNPVSRKGRPNKSSLVGRELAMAYGPDALREQARLAGLLRDPEGNPIQGAEESSVRLSATQYILDRAYGKATQPIAGDDEFDPLRAVMQVRFVNPPDPLALPTAPVVVEGYVEDSVEGE